MVLRALRSQLCTALIIALGSGAFLSSNAALAKGFYSKGEQGWFWYQDPPPPPEPEEKKPEEKKPEEPKVIVMQAPPPAEPLKPVEAVDQGPAPLSAAWFRENLQVYMDKAIDDPSPKNVEAYFLLQRVMMDKAQAFSDMSQRVVMGDPILDEINRRAQDSSTARLQEQLSADRRKEMLAKILDRAGLAFFFQADCDLCDNQAQTLNYLSQRTGIQVMAISVDGQPLRSGTFAETMVVDNGQAEVLGIKGGPSIYLMIPPERWVPLAHGAITQEEVISRIIMASFDEGLIDEDEFNKTKPINVTPSLANTLSKEGKLPEETEDLINLLRSMEQ